MHYVIVYDDAIIHIFHSIYFCCETWEPVKKVRSVPGIGHGLLTHYWTVTYSRSVLATKLMLITPGSLTKLKNPAVVLTTMRTPADKEEEEEGEEEEERVIFRLFDRMGRQPGACHMCMGQLALPPWHLGPTCTSMCKLVLGTPHLRASPPCMRLANAEAPSTSLLFLSFCFFSFRKA